MRQTQTVIPAAAVDAARPPVWGGSRARARSGGAVAALMGPEGPDVALSYAGLVERADALASRLRDHGVAAEQPVAVALDRSADTVVAMLAVLAAGGVYCPVEVAAPPVRTNAILRRLGPPAPPARRPR